MRSSAKLGVIAPWVMPSDVDLEVQNVDLGHGLLIVRHLVLSGNYG